MTLSALVSKDAERKKYKKLYWLRLRASYSNDGKSSFIGPLFTFEDENCERYFGRIEIVDQHSDQAKHVRVHRQWYPGGQGDKKRSSDPVSISPPTAILIN
jgi:hypothetical protein